MPNLRAAARRAIVPSLAALLALLALTTGCRTVAGGSAPALLTRAEAAAREAIANERALVATQLPARTVAVPPLDAAAGDTVATALAFGLADLLVSDLAQSAQLRVVERARMDALLRELALAQSGRVDSASAPRLGRLSGARRVVVGSVTSRGDRFSLSSRVADVASSEVRPAATADASLSEVFDIEKQLAFRLFDALGVVLTPAERQAVEQRPTRNVAAFLAYGRGVRAEALGDFRAARAHYRRAASLDPSFRGARAGVERADAIAGTRLEGSSSALALARATGAVTGSVNPTLVAPSVMPPRIADVVFPAQQLVTLILRVTVP